MDSAAQVVTVPASALTRDTRSEMEVAALECEHLTHSNAVRYALVCTPQRVVALLEELTDVEDELGIIETEVHMLRSSEAAMKAELRRVKDALILAESANVLLKLRLEETEAVLREGGMVGVSFVSEVSPS